MPFLFNKQYMRYQEFPEYAWVRIRTAGLGTTGHEAESTLCHHRSGSMAGSGGSAVDDPEQVAYPLL
jgi:hypothetical protein